MSQPFDLVLHKELFAFQLHHLEIVDSGVGLAVVYLIFEGLMLLFEFRKMRLHRHVRCLLNPGFDESECSKAFCLGVALLFETA